VTLAGHCGERALPLRAVVAITFVDLHLQSGLGVPGSRCFPAGLLERATGFPVRLLQRRTYQAITALLLET